MRQPDEKRRTFVTGIGILQSNASGWEESWQNLLSASVNFSAMHSLPVGRIDFSAVLRDLSDVSATTLDTMDPAVLLGLAAAKQALAHANHPSRVEMGAIVGTSRGATNSFESEFTSYLKSGRVSTHASPATTPGSFSSTVSRTLGLGGLNLMISSACSSGLNGIGVAHNLMQNGLLPSCLAGSSEMSVTPFTLAILDELKILSHAATDDGLTRPFPCMPFHPDRDGTVLGEGAAILCLEQTPRSQPLAEIVGFGSVSEQSTLTGVNPNGDGILLAIERALQSADLSPRDMDLVIAHGTGTARGDAAELAAYERLFDDRVAITCHKWLTGHMLGASSSFSTAMAIKHLKLRSTFDLPYLSDQVLYREELGRFRGQTLKSNRYALICALGFGGTVSALIVKNCDGEE